MRDNSGAITEQDKKAYLEAYENEKNRRATAEAKRTISDVEHGNEESRDPKMLKLAEEVLGKNGDSAQAEKLD